MAGGALGGPGGISQTLSQKGHLMCDGRPSAVTAVLALGRSAQDYAVSTESQMAHGRPSARAVSTRLSM